MKRWLITIAIFVLAGAVVNVAVAWGCMFWSPGGVRNWLPGQERAKPIPLRMLAVHRQHSPSEQPPAANYGKVGFGHHFYVITAEEPGGLRFSTFAWYVGWPMKVFAAYAGHSYTRIEVPFREIVKDRWKSGFLILAENRGVPYLPLWPGFSVNTLFYAGVMWLVIPGPFLLRRVIRVRGGRCGGCGYDLHGAPHDACPECGKARTVAAMSQHRVAVSFSVGAS